MTSQLHQRVRKTIERHQLCPEGTRVLVGISGGSDSVALTFLLRDLAERLGLGIHVQRADVQGYAHGQNLSVEDAARRIRYDFMEQAATLAAADRIAVGHTQDDQAETFLLKLMRGAGLTGLAGIHPRKGRIVRPLLDVPRTELRNYLVARGERWIEDESNADLDNPRNRIRHVVLPELDSAAAGATRPSIARAAGLIRDDGQWLDELAAQRYELLAEKTADGVALEAAALSLEPPPIRRRVLLQAMRAAGNREIGLDHVEAAMAVLAGLSGGVDVPGGRVELKRGKLALIQQKPATK